jgi:hypothetical protein
MKMWISKEAFRRFEGGWYSPGQSGYKNGRRCLEVPTEFLLSTDLVRYRYTNLIKCILKNTVCLTKYPWFERKNFAGITASGFCGHHIRQ